MTSDLKIGYVGLGDMGTGMALNLARSQYDTMVFDLRPQALEEAVRLGARAATSLKEVAEFADEIHFCLVYDEQIVSAILGQDGLLAYSRPGQIIVIHSTIFPKTVQRVAAEAEKVGVDVLDAAVSGGSARSLDGTLTLMVGGDAAVFEKVRPVLELFGTPDLVGSIGAGEAMKLINNSMVHANRLVYLESLQIATAFGIPESKVQEIVTTSTGMSYAQVHMDAFDIRNETHTMGGTPELPYRFGKDLRYATQVALDSLIESPITAVCSQLAPRMYADRWALVAERKKANG